MVRRNPKSIASFSNSLISVVAGISGTPSIPRAALAPQVHTFESITPTLSEREDFFRDIDPMSHAGAVTSSSAVTEEPVNVIEDVVLSVVEIEEIPESPALDAVVETAVSEDVIKVEAVEDIEEKNAESTSSIALGSDLNISLSDYLDIVKPAEESTAADVIAEENPVEEVLAVSEVETVEEVELADAPAVEETIVTETTLEAPVAVSEETELEVEAMAEEPVLESEIVAPATPVVDPVSVTESVVRAVLKQFEDKSDSVPDADMIRSITEQVASQMAAQQTAMRIAQQVLSNQPAVPMSIPLPTGQAVPVPGVAIPSEGVTIQPVAFQVPGVPGEPVAIPGFNPTTYLGSPAPVQYQQGPSVAVPGDPIQYQQGPSVAVPGAPIQYQQGPGVMMPGPVQYQQGPGVMMPGPVQYQQGPTPVWTPPSDDTPVPTQDQLASFVQPQYILNIQSPAGAPDYQASKPTPSAPVERVFPTFEPPKNDVTFDEPTKLPSIDAFDPSAYLGMNAVPSLPSMVQEVVEEEPAWEPVYEFAPVSEDETAIQETEEDIRAREARRAQQMLRELSGLRDLRG